MIDLISYIFEKFNYDKNGDEFYTQESDIKKILHEYNFKNKVVYCNCDNPEFSSFWKVFYDNFKSLELKKLMATYYSDDPYFYEYNGEDIKKTKIESGRFQDNVNYIKECDIVVTNPPFSDNMPIELTKILLDSKVDFIFVGPLHLLTNKEFFGYLKDHKVQAMKHNINKFKRPSGGFKNAPCCWWTNLDITNKEFKPNKEYNESDYPKYDDYDAINCNSWEDIPKNYDGNIGVPYRFITHLNNKQYDIIDMITPKINGKKIYKRMIIKQKGTH